LKCALPNDDPVMTELRKKLPHTKDMEYLHDVNTTEYWRYCLSLEGKLVQPAWIFQDMIRNMGDAADD